jgi:hypothetical protein
MVVLDFVSSTKTTPSSVSACASRRQVHSLGPAQPRLPDLFHPELEWQPQTHPGVRQSTNHFSLFLARDSAARGPGEVEFLCSHSGGQSHRSLRGTSHPASSENPSTLPPAEIGHLSFSKCCCQCPGSHGARPACIFLAGKRLHSLPSLMAAAWAPYVEQTETPRACLCLLH